MADMPHQSRPQYDWIKVKCPSWHERNRERRRPFEATDLVRETSPASKLRTRVRAGRRTSLMLLQIEKLADQQVPDPMAEITRVTIDAGKEMSPRHRNSPIVHRSLLQL